MKLGNLTLSLMALGLLACSNLYRHPESGYRGAERNAFPIPDRAPSSVMVPHGEMNKDLVNQRYSISELENRLETNAERDQYYNYQTYFKSEKDRMNFLSLTTMKERDDYMKSRVFNSKPAEIKEEYISLIENRDIAVGMTKNEIKESWGEPHQVSHAGDPIYENERWSYDRRLKTANGYEDETRHVIFEAGRVAGWKTN